MCNIYDQRRTLIRAGSLVRCKKHIRFSDGTQHVRNQQIIVQEDTLSYFIVMLNDYEILSY